MKCFRITLALFFSFAIVSCSLEGTREEISQKEVFPLVEARAFFEQQIQATPVQEMRGPLSPGEFVPQWDDARMREADGQLVWSVPILPTKLVYSFDGDFHDPQVYKRRHRVEQELVITKGRFGGEPECSLRSRAFATGRKSKAHFNGLLIYTNVVTGALLRVERYQDGNLTGDVSTKDRRLSLKARHTKSKDLMSGFHFRSRPRVGNRSDEEWGDDPGDDPYAGYDYNEDLGWYEDGEGNYYIDIWGDGSWMIPLIPEGPDLDPDDPEDPLDYINIDGVEIQDLNQPDFNYPFDEGDLYVYSSNDVFAIDPPLLTMAPDTISHVTRSCFLSSIAYAAIANGVNMPAISVLIDYATTYKNTAVSNIQEIDKTILNTYGVYRFNAVCVNSREALRQAVYEGHLVLTHALDEGTRKSFCVIGYRPQTNQLIYVDGSSGSVYIESSVYPLFLLHPTVKVGTFNSN
ncbi:MAG: hypothetical protein IJV01_08390 [Bacteroidales bacterium]|nr:hypothetical protein [Bacteroidales bacterium]